MSPLQYPNACLARKWLDKAISKPKWPFLFYFKPCQKLRADVHYQYHVLSNSDPMTEQEISNLLEENLKLNKEIHQLVKKTAVYIKWLRVMDFVKLLLILVPLIAAWIYLPQIIESLLSGYMDIYPSGLR